MATFFLIIVSELSQNAKSPNSAETQTPSYQGRRAIEHLARQWPLPLSESQTQSDLRLHLILFLNFGSVVCLFYGREL